MKRLFSAVLLALFLVGCGSRSEYCDDAMLLRDKLNIASNCKFIATVTLDYGDSLYTFVSRCEADAENNMRVTILEPAAIVGICGEISAESGRLVFDEQILAFEMIADGQITPICTPWLLIQALRSGYISSCGAGTVHIDDSFKGCEFSIEVYLNEDGIPNEAEFVWNGKRVVSMTLNDFAIV